MVVDCFKLAKIQINKEPILSIKKHLKYND